MSGVSEGERYCAFVDESESRQDVDPGTYILSAAICDGAEVKALRQTMELLRPAPRSKLHWKSVPAGEPRRALTQAIANLAVEHLVVIRLGGVEAASERRRRVCLHRMFFELAALGVTEMVAESRGRADDRRDRNLLDQLRAQRQISSALRLDHMPGPSEPLLWIPDVVAGAVAASRTTAEPLQHLASKLTLIEIRDR